VLGNYSHFLAGVAMHFAVGPLRALAERRSPAAAMLWLGCGATALTALTTYGYHVAPTAFWIVGGLFTDAATCAVLGVHIVLEARDRRADGVWAFLSILGLLAYGVYGWHAFLLTLFPQLQGNLGLVSLLTATLACLSYLCLERPMLQLRKRRMHIALPGQG